MTAKYCAALVVFIITFIFNSKILFGQYEENLSEYVWDLSSLYKGQKEWEEERSVIENRIKEIEKYKGTLGNDTESLADAMDAVYDLRSRAGRMYFYGYLYLETNLNSEQAHLQFDVGTALESKVESAVAFIREEIINVNTHKMKEWINNNPRLKKHKPRLNRILYEAPYTLNSESQKIVESMGRWQRLPIDIYDNLFYSDLGWSVLKDGSEKDLTIDAESYNYALRNNHPNRNEIINLYLKNLSRLKMFSVCYLQEE